MIEMTESPKLVFQATSTDFIYYYLINVIQNNRGLKHIHMITARVANCKFTRVLVRLEGRWEGTMNWMNVKRSRKGLGLFGEGGPEN